MQQETTIQLYKEKKQDEVMYEKMMKSSRRTLVMEIRNKIEKLLEPVIFDCPDVEITCCEDNCVKVRRNSYWNNAYVVKVGDNYNGINYTTVLDYSFNDDEQGRQLKKCIDYLLQNSVDLIIYNCYVNHKVIHNEIMETLRSIRTELSELHSSLLDYEVQGLTETLMDSIEVTDALFHYGKTTEHINKLRVLSWSKSKLTADIEITKTNKRIEYLRNVRTYAIHDFVRNWAYTKLQKDLKYIW